MHSLDLHQALTVVVGPRRSLSPAEYCRNIISDLRPFPPVATSTPVALGSPAWLPLSRPSRTIVLMVGTRKSTPTSRASTPRTSATPLNRKSRRKREYEDSEEEYTEQPSSRKRRKSGTPKSGQQRRGSLQDKRGKNKGEPGQEDTNRETAAQLSSDDGEQDGWWQVKRVVDERPTVADNGEIVNKCLVEWEPSPKGRTYEPEWIPVCCAVVL